MTDEPTQFWFNLTTHEVSEGREAPWTSRMGPYPTREAAEAALVKARARTAEWDEDEAREDD